MTPYYRDNNITIYNGDVIETLKKLPNESVNCIITSPPYWGLRDYEVEGQIGLEKTLEEYIDKLLNVTKELKRVLRKDGVMFWNHGDCYGGTGFKGSYKDPKYPRGRNSITPPNSKLTPKCMVLQNFRTIIRMIDEQGWILRNTIIWHKSNHMPSSVKDRFTNAYEPVFFFSKSRKYWFDLDVVRVPHKTNAVKKLRDKSKEPYNKSYPCGHFSPGERPEVHPLGKNPGEVWTIPTQPFPEAHFATYPERLIEPMIKAGCPQWLCKKCGKARVRTTGKGKIIEQRKPEKGLRAKFDKQAGLRNGYIAREIYTIGWTDCGCNADWDSGIVLDPFAGAFTTAVVASKLGRRFIGIELNKEYCDIGIRRIRKEAK